MGVYVATNMGFDNIVAILALPHAEIEINGISLVFGNSMLPQVVRNESGFARALG
jgi:purine nucleosidase